jgi:hypothetical protein
MTQANNQADKIAELLGVSPENVLVSGSYGVLLSTDQVDKLFVLLENRGYDKAIDAMIDLARQTKGESITIKASEGSKYSHRVKVDQTDFAPPTAGRLPVCNCRCKQGRNCGGCGHEGCGYSQDAWTLRA